ncbi:hypothetical protein J2Z57_000420 [Formosa algae]|uniref:Uncharacterized protein n=1 Tax=Formosa algae TaxID=225843 RepID=A0A9X1C8F9_9FLAO|nr:hypothetical protein [Formosa algae]MDQ0333998.1 hypothetical protein [Formosa algae]
MERDIEVKSSSGNTIENVNFWIAGICGKSKKIII